MNLSELMINILCLYLQELNLDFIKYISKKIMSNFICLINKKINNLFIIYKKQNLLSIQQRFIKWKNIINYKDSSHNINDSKRDKNFHLDLNARQMNNSSGNPIIKNNSSSNIIKSYLSNINKENVFNKNNNKIHNLKKEFRNNYSLINSVHQKGKQKSYSSEASRNKNIPIGPVGKENKYDSKKIIEKFIKRQENFIKSNYQKKQKLIKENEKDNKLIYTFEPEVNESLRKLYKKDKLSNCQRLYNDSIVRNNKILEKQIKSNNCKRIKGKLFNHNKILELYEESKTKKEKHEKLIKKIERECGYTYKPKIIDRKKIKKDRYDGTKNMEDRNKKEYRSFNKSNKNSELKNVKKIGKNKSYISLITLNKKEKNN